MRPRNMLLAVVLVGVAPAAAQSVRDERPSMADTEVRTFPLQYLRSKDAAQLVAPYALPLMVFEAGTSVKAITVRDTPAKLAQIDSILRVYDRPPQSVTLRFQLVASTSESTSDSRLREIEPSLRQLFTFKGYRLVGEGTTVVGQGGGYQLTLAGDQRRFALRGQVEGISRGEEPSVRLGVYLTGASAVESDSARAAGMVAAMLPFGSLISTELDLRLGTLAVLGSGTEGIGDGVLILLVRPELR